MNVTNAPREDSWRSIVLLLLLLRLLYIPRCSLASADVVTAHTELEDWNRCLRADRFGWRADRPPHFPPPRHRPRWVARSTTLRRRKNWATASAPPSFRLLRDEMMNARLQPTAKGYCFPSLVMERVSSRFGSAPIKDMSTSLCWLVIGVSKRPLT